MRKKTLPALVVLNAALLVMVAAFWLIPAPSAEAQLGGRGNDYVMVAGDVRGRTDVEVVYILETTSARMAAITYRSDTTRLDVLDGTNIANDVRGAGARR